MFAGTGAPAGRAIGSRVVDFVVGGLLLGLIFLEPDRSTRSLWGIPFGVFVLVVRCEPTGRRSPVPRRCVAYAWIVGGVPAARAS